MLSISKTLRSRFAMIASVGITGALLVASPLVANAAPTVITYTSTNAADYPQLAAVGSGGGVDWAPFTDASGNNAPGMSGALNWNGREGWGGHNFVVQDDGSGTNGALYVHKAQAAAANSGIQVASIANGQSLISKSNKKITFKAKAADANVPLQATLTDFYGGHEMVVNAVLKNAGVYNTVTLDFGRPASGTYTTNFSYTTLKIVFDPANAIAGNVHDDWGQGQASATNSKLYIMDNLTYTLTTGAVEAGNPDVGRLLTFEDNDLLGAKAVGDPNANTGKWAGAFEGAGTGIATPATAHTGKALEFSKGAGGFAWSGVNLFEALAGEVLSSSNYKTVKFDFFSPESADIPVMVKLIPATGATLVRAVTAAPGWNTLTVDFGAADGPGTWSAASKYKQFVVFPNFNEPNTGPSTATTVALGSVYYIDNVLFNGYALPATTDAPTFTLSPTVGTIVNAGEMSWTGNTVKVAYKWYRCNVLGATARASAPITADACTAISGATKSSYTLSKSDKGKYVRVSVIATTTAGSVTALAPSTAKVG